MKGDSMGEQIKCWVYNIDSCGYYAAGRQHRFGHISTMLDDLFDWVKAHGRVIGATRTFEPNKEGTINNVYCADVARNTANGDYLIATWNEIANWSGKTASIEAKKPVGQASVAELEAKQDTIPGFPTYFWLIPEANLLVTVRYDQIENGRRGFQAYMKGFLAKFASQAVTEEEASGELRVKGYRASGGDAPDDRLSPRFSSSLSKIGQQIAVIKNKRRHIRKVIRKNAIYWSLPDAPNLAERLLSFIPFCRTTSDVKPDSNEELRYRMEVEYTPSEAELDSLIEGWIDDHEAEWDDIGFQYKGKQTVVWLSHQVVKLEWDVEIDSDSFKTPHLFDLDWLLRELSEHRTDLTSKVDPPKAVKTGGKRAVHS